MPNRSPSSSARLLAGLLQSSRSGFIRESFSASPVSQCIMQEEEAKRARRSKKGKRGLFLLFLLLLALFASSSLPNTLAQSGRRVKPQSVPERGERDGAAISIRTEEVFLNITVRDSLGRGVDGLKSDDFFIYDNGRRY
ncbi:MAG: hypothetical protein ACREAM_22735, partial [Blastocatellia bacterium]